ncbi:MAG: carbohydrate-binding domain-containing protein [Culicoidibacterales bacterium]
MMKKTFTQGLSLALLLFLTACTNTDQSQLEGAETAPTIVEPDESTTEETTDEMFTARDKEIGYDESNATAITLANENVTIDKEGIYVLSGTLTDGQVIIDVADTEKVQLVLNNVTITAENTAPIYVKSANKVFVTLAAGTTNTLNTTGGFCC